MLQLISLFIFLVWVRECEGEGEGNFSENERERERARKRRVKGDATWVALLVYRYLSNAASFVLCVFAVSRVIIHCQIIRHC